MTTFRTNCTLPIDVVNYVSSPNTRGTFDILWSCLSTLFLCTWSVQHPNVPILRRPRTALGKILKLCYSFLRKLKGMLATLLAPELLLAIAISDHSSAAAHVSKTTQKGLHGIEWSLTHAFYANMGGFVVKFTRDTCCVQDSPLAANQNIPVQGGNLPTEAPQITDGNKTITDAANVVNESDERNVGQSAAYSVSTIPILGADHQIPHNAPITIAPLVNATSSKWSSNKIPLSRSFSKSSALKEISPLIRMLDCYLDKSLSRSSQGLFSPMVISILQDLKEKISKERASDFNINLLSAHLDNLRRLEGDLWALDANQLLHAQEIGLVSIPDISREEIEDQSKGDALVKILAIGQALWQILQLLARWRQGLPSSHAELVTMAYAFCTFWIYVLFWHKPQNVSAPRLIPAERRPRPHELWALARRGPAYLLRRCGTHDYSIPGNAVPRIAAAAAASHPPELGPEDGSSRTLQRRITLWAGGVVCGVLFGLVHCIAWNFTFPTAAERLLWRIASISTSVLPIPWCILGALDRYKHIKRQDSRLVKILYGFHDKFGYMLSLAAVTVYVIIRLFLIVETFRALCFLPPDVFRTTWANFLPHASK